MLMKAVELVISSTNVDLVFSQKIAPRVSPFD
jgi:hypothetical protein